MISSTKASRETALLLLVGGGRLEGGLGTRLSFGRLLCGGQSDQEDCAHLQPHIIIHQMPNSQMFRQNRLLNLNSPGTSCRQLVLGCDAAEAAVGAFIVSRPLHHQPSASAGGHCARAPGRWREMDPRKSEGCVLIIRRRFCTVIHTTCIRPSREEKMRPAEQRVKNCRWPSLISLRVQRTRRRRKDAFASPFFAQISLRKKN